MKQPTYHTILPPQVRFDQQLPFSAKVLYAEVAALCDQQGYCWASNHYFATLYGVHKETISLWLRQLRKRKLIAVQLLKEQGNQRRIYLLKASPPCYEKPQGGGGKTIRGLENASPPSYETIAADTGPLLIDKYIDNNDRVNSTPLMNLSLVKEEKGQATAAAAKEVLAPPSPPVARRPPPPNAEPKQAANQRATASHPFMPPTLSEVEAYLQEQQALCPDRHQAKEQAQRFVNHYQSNGWKVGRNPMQDWQAAANNWLLNMNTFHSPKPKHHETYSRLHTGGKKDYSIPL